VGYLRSFFKTLLMLSALMLASASFALAGQATVRGVTVYADNLLSTNCTSGNYSIANRNCSGRDGDGYRSLQSAVDTSTGGDIIVVRGSAIHYTGSGGGGAILRAEGSSSGNRLTIEGYQNERPIVRGFDAITFVNVHNLIVDMNRIVDTVAVVSADFVRMEDVEVRNAGHHGMYGVRNSEFINMDVHDNGWWNNSGVPCPPHNPLEGQCHGVYSEQNNLFDGGWYHHNAGYGIHCYPSCANTTIRNLQASYNGTGGIIARVGPGIQIDNVIVDNNGQLKAASGLVIMGNNPVAENITAFNNGAAEIQVGDVDHPNGTLRNSIALPNGINATASATLSNNTTTGNASTYFVDAPNGNFELISTSTANNVGADLSLLYD
jgi:hypothetical protein